MVRLVALLQAAQDGDRVRHRRLADEHGLEAPLERGVLLDVLAVLVERGRADAAQLAPGEHRLEHVGGVDGALGRAGTDDRVQLVDEEDDLPRCGLDLGENRLQPFLELTAVLRPGEQRADVERPDALALQSLGHVAGDDALREPFDDRRLADAGVADQHRVVLRPPREHLDHAPDLLVAADHRIELAALRQRGQVAAELLQRLVGALGILRADPLAAAHLLDLRKELVAGNRVEREQQVLGRHVVVLQLLRLVERPIEDLRQRGRHGGLLLPALDPRLPGQLLLGRRAKLFGRFHECARQILVEQCEQQVLGVELGVAEAARALLRGGHRLLRLDRQLVEVHQVALLTGKGDPSR